MKSLPADDEGQVYTVGYFKECGSGGKIPMFLTSGSD